MIKLYKIIIKTFVLFSGWNNKLFLKNCIILVFDYPDLTFAFLS
jgi:hypothetical protein